MNISQIIYPLNQNPLTILIFLFTAALIPSVIKYRRKHKTLRKVFIGWGLMFLGSIGILFALQYSFLYLPFWIPILVMVIVFTGGIVSIIAASILNKK